MKKTILLLILLSQLFSTCRRDRTKVEYSYYESGMIKEKVITFMDEHESFHAFLYSQDGYLLKEINGRGSNLHGLSVTYYPNGNIHKQTQYQNGLACGKMFIFYEDGGIQEIRNYIDDTLCGITQLYNKMGNIREEYLYINNDVEVFRKYYTDSNKIFIKMKVYEQDSSSSLVNKGQLVKRIEDNIPVNDMSMYYTINPETDTLKLGVATSLRITIVNSYDWKPSFILNSNDFILKRVNEIGRNEIGIEIVPKNTGYNLFFGRLLLNLDCQDEASETDFILYKEFFVRE